MKILNVSYDSTREFYQQYNQAFSQYWQHKTGEEVIIRQSHGGSGRQATAVIHGLAADVVTLALAYDIDIIAKYGRIAADWQQRLPYQSAPYTSTVVFLVRQGNPKQIRDWDNLIQPGVSVITANPKTSGGARWNYLAAWGYALTVSEQNEAYAKQFVQALYNNVTIMDLGARSAVNTFVERGLGDVLLMWENEALMTLKAFGDKNFEIVIPSVSILAEPVVAVVDKTVQRKKTLTVATAYVNYLYSEVGQMIAAQHFYRPRDPIIAAQFADRFPSLALFTVNELCGNWLNAQQTHFSSGGLFDQLMYVKVTKQNKK